jgi:hypothetical protein
LHVWSGGVSKNILIQFARLDEEKQKILTKSIDPQRIDASMRRLHF